MKSIKKMGDQLKALRDAMCDEEVYSNILKVVRNTKKGTPGIGKEHNLSAEDKKAIEEIEMQLMEQGKETHGQEIEELETIKAKGADKENTDNEDLSKEGGGGADAGEKVSADDEEEAEMQIEEQTAKPTRNGRKAATKKTPSKTAAKTATKSARGKAKATAKDIEPAAAAKTTRTSRSRKALSTVK